ncbi:MAG: hypothetical protein LAO06_12780, partial [Acidobacteriia bacterium]|nr:hypothetical protein [Terriglobia bacterium]
MLLLSALAFSQAAPPAQKPSTPGTKPSAPPAAKTEVAPTDAVITIDGLCNGKIPATPSPDCKTVITRADFENLVGAIDPQMPIARRQQLGDAYSRMLVMSDIAEQRGIQNTPEAQQIIRFARMQVLMQLPGQADLVRWRPASAPAGRTARRRT